MEMVFMLQFLMKRMIFYKNYSLFLQNLLKARLLYRKDVICKIGLRSCLQYQKEVTWLKSSKHFSTTARTSTPQTSNFQFSEIVLEPCATSATLKFLIFLLRVKELTYLSKFIKKGLSLNWFRNLKQKFIKIGWMKTRNGSSKINPKKLK